MTAKKLRTDSVTLTMTRTDLPFGVVVVAVVGVGILPMGLEDVGED